MFLPELLGAVMTCTAGRAQYCGQDLWQGGGGTTHMFVSTNCAGTAKLEIITWKT